MNKKRLKFGAQFQVKIGLRFPIFAQKFTKNV